MDEEGELVESGSFRVDRARALEKLKSFQFADPNAFILALARAAVAAEAPELRANRLEDGLRLWFSGRPLTLEDLEDPFAGLFSEEFAKDDLKRQIALGLLGALRLKPKLVRVLSSGHALLMESPENYATRPEPEARDGTRVEILFDAGPFSRMPDPLPLLKDGTAMLKIPFFLDDARVRALPESSPTPAVAFEENGVRGVLTAAPNRTGVLSLIGGGAYAQPLHFYRHGVRIGTESHDFSVAAEIHLDSPSFSANATHSGVLEDDARAAAIRAAGAHAAGLVEKAASLQIERAAKDLRGFWTVYGLGSKKVPAWLRLLGRAPLVVGKTRAEDIERVRLEARVCAWLRYTARNILTDPVRDAAFPERLALWNCPLFVSATGRPLTLMQLHRQFRRIGCVPFTEPGALYPDAWVFRFEPFLHVVWKLDDDDGCLRTIFKGKLKTWGAVAAAWDIARIPLRWRFGLKDKDFYDRQAEEA